MQEPDSIYHYSPPPGYGDTFFMYAYNGGLLTNGTEVDGVHINIYDGDFVCRYWAGLETIATKIMIYDPLIRKCFASPVDYSTPRPTGMVVLPERVYPVNNAIRFDLIGINQRSPGVQSGTTIFASQLVFAGVKRRALHYSDPEPSSYPYYEKNFAPNTPGATGSFQLSINKYAADASGNINPPDTYEIPIRDFDFELRRVELQLQSDLQTSQFSITLYDNYQNATSNIPILSNKFFHLDPAHSLGELNFWPSPGILYKVGSYIKFDIWSLLVTPTALPQAFNLLFHGVRRIPCQ